MTQSTVGGENVFEQQMELMAHWSILDEPPSNEQVRHKETDEEMHDRNSELTQLLGKVFKPG